MLPFDMLLLSKSLLRLAGRWIRGVCLLLVWGVVWGVLLPFLFWLLPFVHPDFVVDTREGQSSTRAFRVISLTSFGLLPVGHLISVSPSPIGWAIFIAFVIFVLAVFWAMGTLDFVLGRECDDEWEEDYVFEEPILNEEDRKQLKQLFRRAAQSCHPDRVPEHLKDTAHQLFTQLNAAFQANDIEGVQNISDIVCSGVFRVDLINSQSVASSR
jgi:hypothetical protein